MSANRERVEEGRRTRRRLRALGWYRGAGPAPDGIAGAAEKVRLIERLVEPREGLAAGVRVALADRPEREIAGIEREYAAALAALRAPR